MFNDKIMRELQEVLGELYIKNGTTKEVVKLSQIIDKLIVNEQRNISEIEENWIEFKICVNLM